MRLRRGNGRGHYGGMERLDEIRSVAKGAAIKKLWQGQLSRPVAKAYENARAELEKNEKRKVELKNGL